VNATKMVEVELPVNIHFNKQLFINPLRIDLLRKIKQTGSLNAAAKGLVLSYQNVWTMIDEMNKISPRPLVVKQRGGNGGGGAILSDYGNLILKEYSFIEEEVKKFLKQLNIEINL
jgi:molybdate transport system regulatory protein